MTDKEHIEIAKRLMETIAYCNGAVNRWNPMKYPEKHLSKLTEVAGKFFDENPEMLTDDDILEMCDGEVTEIKNRYGKLDGWNELNIALNEYFNEM